MKTLLSRILLTCFLLSCIGCETVPNQYHWGSYESLLFDGYVNPGEASPQAQIQQLTQTIEAAQARDGQIPPGLYAHLGFMRLNIGDVAGAVADFEAEKALYPESTTFIQGLLDRVKR